MALVRGIEATLEWVDWFNYRRLLEPIGNILPAEERYSAMRMNQPWQRDSNETASGKLGAVHPLGQVMLPKDNLTASTGSLRTPVSPSLSKWPTRPQAIGLGASSGFNVIGGKSRIQFLNHPHR